MKVLFLSEWYPNRYDAMAGLFVQKHAIAAAGQGVDICVLYLHHDTQIKALEINDVTHDGIREITVYYPTNYFRALRKGWKYVRNHWGMPNVCQVNVITKNALLALWLKSRYRIPYIIIEHWSGYLKVFPAYRKSSRWHRWIAETAARNAYMIMPVSEDLLNAMKDCGLCCPRWQIINNVVDDFFYTLPNASRTDSHLNLLHISCFDELHKNVCGLLRAVHAVSKTRNDFTLTIVGIGKDYQTIRQYADSLQFPEHMLRWKGELAPKEVAAEFQKADAFVLSSNDETAAIVLCESLASGKPIVSTSVGLAPIVVNSNTGILVPIGDEKALAEAIATMLVTSKKYDSETIRAYAEPYRFTVVGQHLYNTYKDALCTT